MLKWESNFLVKIYAALDLSLDQNIKPRVLSIFLTTKRACDLLHLGLKLIRISPLWLLIGPPFVLAIRFTPPLALAVTIFPGFGLLEGIFGGIFWGVRLLATWFTSATILWFCIATQSWAHSLGISTFTLFTLWQEKSWEAKNLNLFSMQLLKFSSILLKVKANHKLLFNGFWSYHSQQNGAHHVKGYEKLCHKMVSFHVYHFVWGHLGVWKDVGHQTWTSQNNFLRADQ